MERGREVERGKEGGGEKESPTLDLGSEVTCLSTCGYTSYCSRCLTNILVGERERN